MIVNIFSYSLYDTEGTLRENFVRATQGITRFVQLGILLS